VTSRTSYTTPSVAAVAEVTTPSVIASGRDEG
jgi:hypothetical protein